MTSADLTLESQADASLSIESVLARAEGENFPVAVRLLPRLLREDLLALYAFARWVDQVGDDAPGDRLALLEALSRDVARLPDDEPQTPIVAALVPAVVRHGLPVAALERLIEANREDQYRSRIASWTELVDRCSRSANPIGELVLGMIGRADPQSIALSDAVCTALQVLEHCQDVVEDLRDRGRVYLPAEDLARYGCSEAELTHGPTTPAVRRVISIQVERSRRLLAKGEALLPRLGATGRVLVAGYAAGGFAVCDALERAGFDVASRPVRPARRDVIRHWIRLLVRSVAPRRGRP